MRTPLLPALAAVLILAASSAGAQSPSSAVIDGTVVFVPTQDGSAGTAASIEDLDAIRSLGGIEDGLVLSPDGEGLAFVRRSIRADGEDYQHDVLMLDAEGDGAPRVIGDASGYLFASVGGRLGGAPMQRPPVWSPDGARVAYIAERDGRAEIWVSDAASGASRRAAELSGDVRRFVWTGAAAIVVEIATPRAVLAAEQEAANARGIVLDDRFEPVYRVGLIADDAIGKSTWLADLETGVARPASNEEAEALTAPAQRLPRAEVTATGAFPSATSVPLAPVLITAQGRAQCGLALCQGRIRHLWASSDGASLYFIRPETAGAEVVLYAWTPATNSLRELARVEGVLASCQLGARALFCLLETPANPRRIVAIDLISGAVRTLYDPNPEWRRIAQPRMARFDVRDADGNASFGRLIYPLNWRPGRRYPLIITQYRARGFLGAGVSGEYPVLPMSARGYFVLAVDRPQDEARASRLPFADYQRETELSGSELDVKINAIALMLQHLRSERTIDMDRLAITGMSDGAETLFALLNRGWRFRAAIASTNPSDRSLWWLMSNTYRRDLQRRLAITAPWTTPGDEWSAWWNRNAAVDHAPTYSAPLLLNLPETEILVAMPLITRLREEGRPVEVYLYPGAHHLKTRPSQLNIIQHRNLDWLDFWLRDVETDDALEPSRRTRWNSLSLQPVGSSH